jgi:hypothetical protein
MCLPRGVSLSPVRQAGKGFFAPANDRPEPMQKTDDRTEQDEAKPAPQPRERARAKSYLDLWERHLVQTAVRGPVPHWIPLRK